jgi:hypothetical protein
MDDHDDQHHKSKRQVRHMPVSKKVLHHRKSFDPPVQFDVVFYQPYHLPGILSVKVVLSEHFSNLVDRFPVCCPVFKET